MLTFLAPSGLLALLGVAVPLAIHLWNRRPGRTVQVGSIRWLAVAANRRLRNLRLEQVLLLLLRAAVVAVLAAAVAGPVWRQPPPPRRGQVLLSPDVLASESLPAVRPAIDSLRRRGYVLRQLRRGFPRISDTTWQQNLPFPADSAEASRQFWVRVRQAADSFPGQPVRVYTSATLRHFQGSCPALPANVSWQTVPLPNRPTSWLAGASLTAPDSLRLVVRRSTDDGVQTSFRTVAKPAQSTQLLPRVAGLSALRYRSATAGRSFIEVQGPDSAQVSVQTEPLRLWVHHDADHALDARYLRAALHAAALGLAPRLELTVSSSAPPPGQPLDWLFWLSNAPVPAAWQQQVAQGLNLWQDARKSSAALKTEFSVPPHHHVYQVSRLDTVAGPTSGVVLWQAAAGQPVLSRRPMGQGNFYRFRSRLHPAWGTLVDSPDLPLLWLSLLQPDLTVAPAPSHDQRLLDPAQIASSARLTPATVTAAATAPAVDLRPWVVLAAALLWGLERLVAGRISSAKTLAV